MNTLWTRDFSLAFVANFLMSASFYLLMPTLPLHLTKALGASTAEAGIVMSAYVIAALLMRPFSGFLIDSFPRKTLYILSYVLFVVLTVTYLGAHSVAAFLVLRLLHGLVWGVITTSGNTLAIDIVPSERRGEGIGYFGMSTNIAMALGPMTGLLLAGRYTFALVCGVAVGIGLLGLLLASIIRAPHHGPRPHQVLSLDRFLLVPAVPLGAALMCITVSYGIMLAYVAMYGQQQRIAGSSFFFMVLAAGIISARLSSGKLLDRGFGVHVAVTGSLCAAVSLLALGLWPVAGCYFAAALFLGMGYGMIFPAVQTLIVNMGSHHQRGTANSTFFTAFDLGVGAGMLGGGLLADRLGLGAVFAWASAGILSGTVLLVRQAWIAKQA